MTTFKTSQFDIKRESTGQDSRVVKAESRVERVITEFEYSRLGNSAAGDYAAVKNKFGPLAATDLDRGTKNRKDSRFSLNPLLRGPLSVEEEERRVIEAKVKERVDALWAEAKEKAHEEGYRDGLKAGREEAFNKFRLAGEEKLKSLDSFITNCESAKDEIFMANERFLVELVFRIGRMVTMRELATDKAYVTRLIKDLLERVGARENITIRLNPKDMATAGAIREGIEKQLGSLKNLNFEASEQVNGGGCAIETEWNAIDASIGKQMENIYQALIGESQNTVPGSNENGRSGV